MRTYIALLDADLAPKPVQQQSPGWLGLVVWAAIAALGVALGLAFLLAPKPTAETVRRVVQAAEALVTNDPSKPAAEGDQPTTLSGRRPWWRATPDALRRSASKPARHAPVPVQAVPVPPVAPEGSPLPNAELPPGTARARVRELLGEPDLTLYKLEKNHVVEHFVYVNPVQNHASSVLLMDGRVASVDIGIPSVRAVASVSRIGK